MKLFVKIKNLLIGEKIRNNQFNLFNKNNRKLKFKIKKKMYVTFNVRITTHSKKLTLQKKNIFYSMVEWNNNSC